MIKIAALVILVAMAWVGGPATVQAGTCCWCCEKTGGCSNVPAGRCDCSQCKKKKKSMWPNTNESVIMSKADNLTTHAQCRICEF